MPGDSRFMWWWDQYVVRESELPIDECSFKISCIVAVTKLSVGREGI